MIVLCKNCKHREEDCSCKVLYSHIYIETEDNGIIAVSAEPDDDFGCIYGSTKYAT